MRIFSVWIASLCLTAAALAATSFPALTGRVVDNAHVMLPIERDALTQQLADYEAKTTNQLVVVTVPSLHGQPIEEFGYQLGRQWGIGQKGKDNGVLLIVAPKEHQVRIEVGYGLEGALTDATSNGIIHHTILPEFKQGQMGQGIVQGVDAIEAAISGGPSASSQLEVVTESDAGQMPDWLGAALTWYVVLQFIGAGLVMAFGVLGSIVMLLRGKIGQPNVLKRIVPGGLFRFFLWIIFPFAMLMLFGKRYTSISSSSSSDSSSGGGFSGGGGSFGGGGSSGNW